MKDKKLVKVLLVTILTWVNLGFILFIWYSLNGEEIPYSQAINVLEEKLEHVTKVEVKPKNNEIIISLEEDDKNVRYNTIVPNTENFIETVLDLKSQSEANFDISISKSMFSYVFGYIIFACLYFIINSYWKAIFESKNLKKNTEIEQDENEDSTHKFSFSFTESDPFKDIKKLFSNDFSEEIELHIVKDVNTTFADVAGMENAKSALMDIATGILESEKYEEYGAKIPSGILLEGAPGTGKTLLARALAGEINIPFIQYSATEMSSKFVGESEAKVRQIFQCAKENAPCIIFFDEIDSISKSRKNNDRSYENTLLNQLLTCLDGFTPRDGVIFIAATNFVESLDEAIKRPGRFDRIVHVDLPNAEEREAILKVHARNKKLSSEIDLNDLARNTATLSGAYLANILNEAAIIQLKAEHPFIMPEDIMEAHRKVLFGPKSTRKLSSEEKHLTAIHELGHAFTHKEDIKEISVIPRGDMGGYTWYNYTEETYITSKKIKEQLVAFLGGRAAEQVILGEISTGAQSDMERAWEMAYDYVSKYGMSDKMGPISISRNSMSEVTKEVIFEETKKMISEAYEIAKKIVEDKQLLIEEIAKVLEEKGTILGTDFYKMI